MPCLTTPEPRPRTPCRFERAATRRLALVLTCLVAAGCLPALGIARSPAAYRAPWLVVAYPDRGGVVPADRPLVVLRFASREADDPIDPASFRATVDAADRTSLFRLTPGEAWAMLADSSARPVVAPGPHAVSARICSARGACSQLDATLLVGPPGSAPR